MLGRRTIAAAGAVAVPLAAILVVALITDHPVGAARDRAERRVGWIGFGGEVYRPTAHIFGEADLWIGRSSRSL